MAKRYLRRDEVPQHGRDAVLLQHALSVDACRTLYELDSPRLPSQWASDPRRKVYVPPAGSVARSLLYNVVKAR